MPTLDSFVRNATCSFRFGSETEMGKHLAGLIGGRNDAVFDRGQFRSWLIGPDGWAHIADGEVARAAAAYEGKTYTSPEQPNRRMVIKLSASRAKGVVTQAAKELTQTGFFDDAILGAAFKSQFVRVDGKNVVVEPHAREHRTFSEHIQPYDLVSEQQAIAAMPAFGKFLGESWAGRSDIQERVSFLGEYIGAALLRQTWRYKNNPLFVGAKDTGKSVMLSAIRSIFPPETATCVTLQAMETDFGLAPLVDASVNIVTELPAATIKAGEKAKAILVGDPVMVNKKYAQLFTFRCYCGHFLAANALPKVPDAALRERLAVLDFPNVVPEGRQDKALTDKLAAEAQMIASWAVWMAAAGVIVRGQFVRPPLSERLGQSWGMESDSVLAWATEEVVPGGDADFVHSATLYSSYSFWCAGRGEQPVDRSVFGRRLTRAGFVGKNRGGRGYLVRYVTEAEKTAKRCWKT